MRLRGMLVAGLFTFLFFTFLGTPPAAADTSPAVLAEATSLTDHEAAVYFIEGSAQILKKNASSWEPLSVGAPIQEGDQVRTAENSAVELEFDKFLQNRSRIEASTLAEFKSIEPTQIHLSDGALLNMLEGLPSGSGFEVVSPTAVASVRGTIFVTSYQASAQTQKASVIQGQVQLFVPTAPGSTETNLPSWQIKRYESLDLDFRPEAISSLGKSRTRLITPEELAEARARAEDSLSHLEDFHGGSIAIEQAAAAWNELLTDVNRMKSINDVLAERASRLLSPQLVKSAASLDSGGRSHAFDEVAIDSRVIKTEAEAALQNQLIGAREAGLGSPDED